MFAIEDPSPRCPLLLQLFSMPSDFCFLERRKTTKPRNSTSHVQHCNLNCLCIPRSLVTGLNGFLVPLLAIPTRLLGITRSIPHLRLQAAFRDEGFLIIKLLPVPVCSVMIAGELGTVKYSSIQSRGRRSHRRLGLSKQFMQRTAAFDSPATGCCWEPRITTGSGRKQLFLSTDRSHGCD